MMEKMWKRGLAGLLSAALLLSCVPATVFAADSTDTVDGVFSGVLSIEEDASQTETAEVITSVLPIQESDPLEETAGISSSEGNSQEGASLKKSRIRNLSVFQITDVDPDSDTSSSSASLTGDDSGIATTADKPDGYYSPWISVVGAADNTIGGFDYWASAPASVTVGAGGFGISVSGIVSGSGSKTDQGDERFSGSYTAAAPGYATTRTFSASVRDSYGGSASDSTTVTWVCHSVSVSYSNGSASASVSFPSSAGHADAVNYRWNTGATTSSISITSPGQYTCTVTVSGVSQSDSVTVTASQLDSTPPSVYITASPSGWTNGSVTLTAHGSDNLGLASNPYNWGSGYSSSSSKTVSSNGTYSVTVKDGVGLTASDSYTVSNIDTGDPVVSSLTSELDKSTGTATLTATATDSKSGVSQYYFSMNANRTGGSGWQSSSSYSGVSVAGTWYCWAKDKAGNISSSASVNVILDSGPPTNVSLSAEPSGWTSGAVTLTASATDDIGVTGYYFSQSSTAPAASASGWQTSNQKTGVTAKGTWYVWAKDAVGNVSSAASTVVYYDATAPSGVTLKSSDNGSWTSSAVTLTASASDGESGVAGYYFSTSSREPSASASGWQSGNTKTVTSYGTWYVWAKDNVGNVSSAASVYVYYDPLAITTQPQDVATYFDTATETRVYFSSAPGTTLYAYYRWNSYSDSDFTNDSYLRYTRDDAGEMRSYGIASDVRTAPYYSGDKVLYVWFKLVGPSGKTVASRVSTITRYGPTITSLAANPTGWGSSVTLTATATDTMGPGIVSYYFSQSSDNPTGSESGWQSSNQKVVTSTGYWYCWAKSSSGYISAKKYVYAYADPTPPTVSATWSGSGTSSAYTNGPVSIKMTINDSGGSGLYGYAVTTSSSAPSNWTTQTSAGTYTVNQNITANTTFYCWVKDNAGNTAYTTVSPQYDKTNPTVSAGWTGSGTSSAYTNGAVKISATIADSGGSGLYGYTITKSSSVPSSWTTTTSAGTYSVDQTITGDTTFYVWVKDAAGNTACTTVSPKYDKTNPTVSAGWTGSGTSSEYTNGAVKISMNINDAGGSGLYGYAVTTSSAVPGSWTTTTTAGNYTLSRTIAGNTTFYCWVKDNAGNTAYTTISPKYDKTVPTVSMKAEPSGWTNGAVTLRATASDNASGIAGYYFSQTNSAPGATASGWQSGSTKSVTSTGDWYVWVKDGANNVSAVGSTKVYYDTLKPTMKSLTASPATWTNGAVTLTASATDAAASGANGSSGIAGYYFTQTKLTAAPAANAAEWQAGTTKSVTSTGTWYCWTKDNAGNVSEQAMSVEVKYDTLKPTMTSLTASPASWTNQTVTLTAAATDAAASGANGRSDIAGYFFKFNDSTAPTATASGWQTGADMNVKKVTQNGTWYCWTKDKAGNVSAEPASVIVYYDVLDPSITITADPSNYCDDYDKVPDKLKTDEQIVIIDNDIWTKGDVVLHAAATDAEAKGNSGKSDIVGYYWTDDVNFKPTLETKFSAVDPTVTVTDNLQTRYCWTRDKAGNFKRAEYKVIHIDKTGPSVTVTHDPTEWTYDGITLTMTAVDNSDGIGLYDAADPKDTPVVYPYSYDGGKTWTDDFEPIVDQDGLHYKDADGNTQTIFHGSSVDFSGNDVYTIQVRDKLKNVTEIKYTADNLDYQAPDIVGYEFSSASVNGIPYPDGKVLGDGDWTNQDITVTIKATDAHSGVGQFALGKVTNINTDFTEKDGIARANFNVSADGSYYTFVWDKVGNTKLGQVTVKHTDKLKPRITSLTSSNEELTLEPITLTVVAVDQEATADSGSSGIYGYYWSTSATAPTSITQFGTSDTQEVKQNATWYCWAIDKAGNISDPASYKVTNIDIKPPSASVSHTPAAWTNTDVTLEVTAEDNEGGIGLHETAYSYDGGKTWTADPNYVVQANGTYTVMVRDAFENTTTVTHVVENIDKLRPSMTSLDADPSDWTNKTVTLTAAAADQDDPTGQNGRSDISGYYFTQTDLSTAPGADDPQWQTEAVKTVDANGTWYCWTKDRAGNVSEASLSVLVKYDVLAPVVDALTASEYNWTNKPITLTAQAHDPDADASSGRSEIAGYYFTQAESETAPAAADKGWQESDTKEVTSNGTWYVWVKDTAGNMSGEPLSVLVKYDVLAPVMDTVTASEYSWTNQMITLTAQAHDQDPDAVSGRSEIAGYYFTQTELETAPTATVEGWQESNVKQITSVGIWYVWVRDTSGNVSEKPISVKAKYDTLKPSMRTLTASPSTWTNSAVTLTASAADAEASGANGSSGIAGYYFTQTELTDAPAADGEGWQIGEGMERKIVEANGIWYCWTKDNAGNVSEKAMSVEVKYDTLKPSMNDLTVTPTVWTNSAATLTASATDAAASEVNGFSDIAGYYFTQEELTAAPAANSQQWQTDAKKNVTSNGTWYCWTKDNAGNVSEKALSVLVKYDEEKPTVTMTATDDPTGDLYVDGFHCGSVTLNANAKDQATAISGASGIAELGYYWSTNSTPPTGDSQWTSSGSQLVKENGTWYCWVRDNAGNISEAASMTVDNIDVTGPTITATNAPTGWTKEKVTVTISAVDNQSGVRTTEAFSFDGGKTWIDGTTSDGDTYITKVTINMFGGGLTYTTNDGKKVTVEPIEWAIMPDGSVDQSGNGKYTIMARDQLGNESTLIHTISTMDPYAPNINGHTVVDAEDPTRDLTNGGWTNHDVILSVTVDPNISGIANYQMKPKLRPDTFENTIGSFRISVNDTYDVTARSKAGVTSDAESYAITCIDKIAPEMTDLTITEDAQMKAHDGWTNQPVELVASAKDVDDTNVPQDYGTSGVKWYLFTQATDKPTENTKGWQEAAKTTVTSYGTWYCWAKDEAGNVSDNCLSVFVKYDAEAPAASVSQSPTDWTNTDVVVSVVAAKDNTNGIGLHEKAYSFDDGKTWRTSASYTVSGNQSLSIRVRDKLENTTQTIPYTVSNIDKTAPVIGSTSYSYDYNTGALTYTLSSLTDTPSGTDGESGIAAYYVSTGATAPAADANGWTALNGSTSYTVTVSANSNRYTWIKDKAGNISAMRTLGYQAANVNILDSAYTGSSFFADGTANNATLASACGGNWSVSVTSPNGVSLTTPGTFGSSYSKWGTDNANSKLGLTLLAGGTEYDLSQVSSVSNVTGVRLYNAAAYNVQTARTFVIHMEQSGGVETVLAVTVGAVANKKLDITVPVKAVIELDQLQGSAVSDTDLTVKNNCAYPLSVSMGTVSAKTTQTDGKDVELGLVSRNYTFGTNDYLTWTGAKLGIQSDGNKYYYEPGAASQDTFATLSSSGQATFRYFMEFSKNYVGAVDKTFGYRIGYSVQIPTADVS